MQHVYQPFFNKLRLRHNLKHVRKIKFHLGVTFMAFGVATDEDQSTFHPRIFPLVTILLILITFSFDMFY